MMTFARLMWLTMPFIYTDTHLDVNKSTKLPLSDDVLFEISCFLLRYLLFVFEYVM